MTRPARRGVLVFGPPEVTARWARELGRDLDLASDSLWVSPTEALATPPRRLSEHLGRGLALVVLDAHAGLDPDALAACHGFVRAGGALVIRLSQELPPPDPKLAAWPHTPAEVSSRFERRARAVLSRHLELADTDVAPAPLMPPPPITRGTAEQDALIASLKTTLRPGAATVLTADRGRGKSAAMGLLIAAVPERRVAVTAASPDAVGEVLRFAPPLAAPVVPLDALLADPDCDAREARDKLDKLDDLKDLHVLVIDEAATLPVPFLRRLTLAHPHAHLCFATTVHGYEGTGRGFALRFLPWLASQRPTTLYTLREPVRWAADCPLERAVFDALVLDAELPAIDASILSKIEILDRQTISAGSTAAERDLHDLFGLLVHAHYRTTPSDLKRLLDAPNLAVHVARIGPEHRIAAACLVAMEGGLTPELSALVHAGQTRLQSHALADALVCHLGAIDAGPMTMVRSVRIATHPALRRVGLARALVEHVHQSYEVDLFGTLFGASPDLLAFRRNLGYRLVRVSASRNQRTGEPSVLMVRPVSERAMDLVGRLEQQLARELPTQLALLRNEGLGLENDLAHTLQLDLAPAVAYTDDEAFALARAYAHGPRTFESVAAALSLFLRNADLSPLSPSERALVTARAVHHRSWDEAAHQAGLAHAGLAMRMMRRALAALLG